MRGGGVTSLAYGLLWMLLDPDEPEMRIVRVPWFIADAHKKPLHWRTRVAP